MIRSLSPDDVPAMVKLHAASFNYGWGDTDMAPHIEKDFVLGYGQPLSGFLIIRTAVDQAEILTVAVDETERRSGVATQLLKAGEKKSASSGVEVIFLEVAEDNPVAIKFYRKMNYEEFARRPGYYKRPGGRVAALVFRKQL